MASSKKMIFLYGAGGHAKVIVDIIEKENRHELAFIVDDRPGLKGKTLLDYPIIGGREELFKISKRPLKAVVSIGENQAREIVANWLSDHGFGFASVIHPSASIARDVKIGYGTVIMANVAVNACTRIGNHAVINTGASIDHDCTIGDYVHIAPGAVLCGTVRVGRLSLVGAGSVIIPNIRIGENALIGAGTTVHYDLVDGAKIVGPRAGRVDG